MEVDSKDSCGKTPLSRAADNGNEAIVKLLLDTGRVDVNWKDSEGLTLLSRAKARGHEAVMKLLLSYNKGDTNLKDHDNPSLLYVAGQSTRMLLSPLLSSA
jgi:ankyrin repeat protein